LKPSFIAKQNECWLCSFRNRPYQVTSLQSATLLHLICLGVCEPQFSIWLLYSRLLSVRLMSTGVMETVAEGVTLVRIWTKFSAVRSLLTRATVSRWLIHCKQLRKLTVVWA